MAEQPPKSLLHDVAELGHSLADLARVFTNPHPDVGDFPADLPPDPPAHLLLPPPDPHSEDPQRLTQHTPGWHRPNPSTLAAPTYAPAMTAFGLVFVALGAVTMWPLSVIGAIIFVLAIAKWIGELLP